MKPRPALRLKAALLRTDERKFTARSKSVGEHYAGKHEGKRESNQSKEKAVFGMHTFGISYWLFVDVSFVD